MYKHPKQLYVQLDAHLIEWLHAYIFPLRQIYRTYYALVFETEKERKYVVECVLRPQSNTFLENLYAFLYYVQF